MSNHQVLAGVAMLAPAYVAASLTSNYISDRSLTHKEGFISAAKHGVVYAGATAIVFFGLLGVIHIVEGCTTMLPAPCSGVNPALFKQ